ncbi:hypothetical protein ACFZCK_04615 [Kitasatospora purpeofusca]|uniref:hypothetical protein n=1 Tax=Kitasatospora purpeofusca TaxID=67352 RepID=UPI0036DFE5AF
MSVPPAAEPTLWELQRALTQLREDQRDGIAGLRDDLRADLQVLVTRIDQAVTKDVYAADQRALNQRVEVTERDLRAEARAREETEARAVATRRWLVGAFVAPVVVAIIEFYLLSKGGGP